MFQSSVICICFGLQHRTRSEAVAFFTQSHEVVISENIITWILDGRSLEQVCVCGHCFFLLWKCMFCISDRLVLGVLGLLYLLIWMRHLRSLVGTCGDGLGDCHINYGLFDIGSHYISVFFKVCVIVLCDWCFFTVCVPKGVLMCWVSVFWPHCHPLWQVWEVV